jgi:hypothetical protein
LCVSDTPSSFGMSARGTVYEGGVRREADQAADGRAALARGANGREENTAHGHLHVRIVHNYQRAPAMDQSLYMQVGIYVCLSVCGCTHVCLYVALPVVYVRTYNGIVTAELQQRAAWTRQGAV